MLCTPPVAATSFFIHRTEIFDFVVRWDKKVYRRQTSLAPKIFHLSVSHRKFLANLIIYWWEMCLIFAINGWFRVFVAATYFAICLTPKTLHTTVSHQIIIANTAKVVQNFLIKDAWETHNDGEFINCKCFIRRKYDNVKIF